MTLSSEDPVHGILGFAKTSARHFELRVYPFEFGESVAEKCVLKVDIFETDQRLEDIERFVDEEVWILPGVDKVQIGDPYNDRETSVGGLRVATEWVELDAGYLFGCFKRQETWIGKLNESLTKELHKKNAARAIGIELLRRAEIKATASTEQHARQTAVIAALERVLKELENG
jgi:hypothetical protein